MEKFTDKVGKWRKNLQRVEEDIPKFAVFCTLPEDDKKRSKVKFEREHEWVEGPMAYGLWFAEVRTKGNNWNFGSKRPIR
jgi:hypothetical protein